MNWRIAALQAVALPLGYAAKKKMERETRFELATSTLARSHSTTELFPLNENCKLDADDFFVNKKMIFFASNRDKIFRPDCF